jgi:large subunit ribosomal protein L18
MEAIKLKAKRLVRRKLSIRKKIRGTAERMRLSVYRSLNNIYAQIINDDTHATLVSASSLDKDIASQITKEMTKTDISKLVGKILGERAVAKDIKSVTFDRNGKIYHGRIKSLAEAAREAGLEF